MRKEREDDIFLQLDGAGVALLEYMVAIPKYLLWDISSHRHKISPIRFNNAVFPGLRKTQIIPCAKNGKSAVAPY